MIALNGTATIDSVVQTITFTPAAGCTGAASFDYLVSDGMASSTASVSLTVNATGDVFNDSAGDDNHTGDR